MKIAWFSPIPPAMTEIANYTERLLPHLKSQFDIDLFTDQIKISTLCKQFNVYNYIEEDFNINVLDEYDHIIYNIGNNHLFHKNIWNMSRKKPGIIILHEGVLHHFFLSIFNNNENFQYYLYTIIKLYGEEALHEIIEGFKGEKDINEVMTKYPLTEIGLLGAKAVIVHSQTLYEKLYGKYYVKQLNLPFDVNGNYVKKKERLIEKHSLVIFGHLGFNRRVENILEAFSKLPRRKEFKLTIMGNYQIDVSKMINKFSLQNEVELLGFVSEEKLDEKISQASMIFNLRYPTMNETSSSQLRIWSHAVPSLVTKVGWYDELPDDVVFKVNIETEQEDIHKYLQMFLDNTGYFKKVGENGRDYLIKNYTCSKYAKNLKDFLKEEYIDGFIKNNDLNLLDASVHLDCRYLKYIVDISKTRPIMIWGAGSAGKKALDLFSKIDVVVSGFIDSDCKKWKSEIEGIKVFHPNILIDSSNKYRPFIIIASTYEEEIKTRLETMNYKHTADFMTQCINVPILFLY